MALVSKNPATEEVLATFEELTTEEINSSIEKIHSSYKKWSKLSIDERLERVEKLIPALEEKKEEIAKIMTWEMGKPISQGVGEIDKCILLIKHYREKAEAYLAPEKVETEAKETYIRFDSMGVVLGIMPWNFPFWQAIRCIVPNLISGNTVLLKHASNVPQASKLLQTVFDNAGLSDVFHNLHISSSKVEQVIRNNRIIGVALTGSENAGKEVAKIAGSELKKCVMELGGSDPFVILSDCDLEAATKAAVTSRTRNNGQACNAAKRFIVEESIFEEFMKKFKEGFENLKLGDPMDGTTDIGPVVNEQALLDLEKLVNDSLKLGAKTILGGERSGTKGYFYKPSIILLNESSESINRSMPLYTEEAFGPVAVVIKVKDKDQAKEVANDTKFGLGASIWTKDSEVAQEMIRDIEAGSVYINSMVSSDPRTPFGGIKSSGFGREMGRDGIREFTNIKTVLVK